MAAPGTAAPFGSVTVPLISPVAVCAKATVAQTNSRRTKSRGYLRKRIARLLSTSFELTKGENQILTVELELDAHGTLLVPEQGYRTPSDNEGMPAHSRIY